MDELNPLPHQVYFSELLYNALKDKGYTYLAGKPRSGKTLTAILAAERSDRINSVLVLTKKAAISGWEKFTKQPWLKHKYHITNYEQVGRVVNSKARLNLRKEDYQLVIIDESHNIGKFPKPSQRWMLIRLLCWNMPHIHLSGTAIVESPCGIYHQMTISKFSPFREANFYDFHRRWGEPKTIWLGGKQVNRYDDYKPELLEKIDEFTIYMTQEDAGISSDMQAVDKLHYVELSPDTRDKYNKLQNNRMLKVGDSVIIGDTAMKLITSLHMLESGVAKIDDDYIMLGNTEKIDYILEHFGDNTKVGIMCHFVGERQLLSKHFQKANIYSATSHAEGVDLSHLESFIIFSSGYSGAKFIQRRERIVNVGGSNTLTVHHLLVKGAVSEQVYDITSKKLDFNNSTYEVHPL